MRPAWTSRLPERIAIGSVWLIPLLLMHAHAGAEALIGVVGACFLIRCAATRDWGWLRAGWVPFAIAWWAWVAICTALMWERSLGQALLQARFPLFVAALEHFALRDRAARRGLGAVVTACVLWIVGQAALQFAIGRNLFGYGRGPAGELTGPFEKPRAGPPLARILLPALIPPAAALLARRRAGATLAAYALLLGGVAAMVLINQRMPLLLVVLGMAVCALLLRRLRPVVVAAFVAAIVLIGASVVISPYTYQRLVVQFSHQIETFGSSHYGEILARSSEIGRLNPWTGLGYDGFRHGCDRRRYFRPSLDGGEPDGGGATICSQHPHNFYMEAFDSGGVPGLLLFAALALAWLAPLGRGLWRDPAPLRVGLFSAVLIQLWPLASTSAFNSLPMGGWLFLLLGWGLAEARVAAAAADQETGPLPPVS